MINLTIFDWGNEFLWIKWKNKRSSKKLTIKSYSNVSNIIITYYLKFRIPIRHRQFFRIISQSKKYVKSFCDDLNNLSFLLQKMVLRQSKDFFYWNIFF